jgi:GMP reductase
MKTSKAGVGHWNRPYRYKQLKYSDVSLIPDYSECETRSSLDASVKFGNHKFRLPVIPANMRAVIDEDLARWLSANDYMYIMHRFGIDILEFVRKANEEDWVNISISIGVKDHELLAKLASLKLRIDFITIDIAHGHSQNMKRAVEGVRRYFPDVYLIAGNVATRIATEDLISWGADCVKVGIGQGAACTTKDKTGFTLPMFTCTQNCSGDYFGLRYFDTPWRGKPSLDDTGAELKKRLPVIADGGMRCNGDVAKALTAGAVMVMAGSQFSACLDSPAETVKINQAVYKRYFGSASEQNKREKRHIEGVTKEIPSNYMTYEEKLRELGQDLQSAISYAGGKDLSCFNKVKYTLL